MSAIAKPAGHQLSVREHLVQQHNRKLAVSSVAVELPDWPDLYVRFRSLDDYSEVRDIAQEISVRASSDTQAEIQAAIATLRISAQDAYAKVNGETHELPPLGMELYEYLYPGGDDDEDGAIGPATDDEAIVLLFRGTNAIVALANELSGRFGATGIKVDEELAKNS